MNNQADSKNSSEIVNILQHHKNIFGIKGDLQRNDYMNMQDKIFSLYRLFCLLDDKYDTKLSSDFLYDILEMLYYYNKTFTKNIKEEHLVFKDEFIAIINTKLYYFDQLICYMANNSAETTNYLRTQHIYKLISTQHFLDATKRNLKNIIGTLYFSSTPKLTPKYEKISIDFILSVPELNKQKDVIDPILDRLIKSKSKITLFKDMDDIDIKNLISVFKFSTFTPGEIIINEGEISTDIFFILSGECSATVNKSNVGTLKKNQIFGEFAFLLQQPRCATIRAIKETVIVKFRFDEKLFREYPFSFSILYKNITEELIIKIINMNKLKSECLINYD